MNYEVSTDVDLESLQTEKTLLVSLNPDVRKIKLQDAGPAKLIPDYHGWIQVIKEPGMNPSYRAEFREMGQVCRKYFGSDAGACLEWWEERLGCSIGLELHPLGGFRVYTNTAKTPETEFIFEKMGSSEDPSVTYVVLATSVEVARMKLCAHLSIVGSANCGDAERKEFLEYCGIGLVRDQTLHTVHIR